MDGGKRKRPEDNTLHHSEISDPGPEAIALTDHSAADDVAETESPGHKDGAKFATRGRPHGFDHGTKEFREHERARIQASRARDREARIEARIVSYCHY